MKRETIFILVFIMIVVPSIAYAAEVWDMPFDTLSNYSRLSNSQLRYYCERHMQSAIAEAIDLDDDGIVDGMDIEVYEFIARMMIILSDQKPFEYQSEIGDSQNAVAPLVDWDEICPQATKM